MPINGLTNDTRLPRLGKIRTGKRNPDTGYPMKTAYFVLPEDHPAYNKLVEAFGKAPKELRVMIPVEDDEQWCPQYYKAYNQTYGLVCKGDGNTASRMADSQTGGLPVGDTKTAKGTVTVIRKDIPCLGKECPEYKAKKCKAVMNLRFMLPEIPGLGIWQIDTGSINSILNINSCAGVIKKTFGRISVIPLKLTLEPIFVNNPENGKKQTVYVLNLRTDATLTQLAEAARGSLNNLRLDSPETQAMLEDENDALWDNDPVAPQGEVIDSPATTVEQDWDNMKREEAPETPVPTKKEPTLSQKLNLAIKESGYTPDEIKAYIANPDKYGVESLNNLTLEQQKELTIAMMGYEIPKIKPPELFQGKES